jgi:iron complex transport system permease protein
LGSTNLIAPGQVVAQLLAGPGRDGSENAIVWDIRLPRTVACVLIGAILGATGSAFQALFRNPLADPYVAGVSSGAAVGGVVAVILGLSGGIGLFLAGTLGGLAALALVWSLAQRRGAADVTTLLLAGLVIGTLLSAVLSMLLLGSGRDSNALLRWLLGSTTPAFWDVNALLAAVAVTGGLILSRQTRRLNAFAVGEDSAQRLGVETGKLKRTVLVTGTAMTAAAVGAAGIISFLGLVAPHIARRLLGVDWRVSLPGSMLVGAALLLLADALAQRAIYGVELPVGILTALLGAPSLLILLRQER